MKAQVTKVGILDMQVCVPVDWNDEQVVRFAEAENPAGTMNGWQIRKQGHERLSGDPERVQCANRADFVHIMLEV